ncbi:MAG: hypothetical protein R3F43_32230 [bacterium]
MGRPYAALLAAQGGESPYFWGLGAGLPPGIALDAATGGLAGTPAEAGALSLGLLRSPSPTTPAPSPRPTSA